MTSTGENALIRSLTHLQKAQEVVANNLANATSPGFKRRHLVAEARTSPFAQLLPQGARPDAAAAVSTKHVDLDRGELLPTGDNTQIAVEGPAFVAERGADGDVQLSRGGALLVDRDGVLRAAATGAAILSPNGAELVVGAEASSIRIAPDGQVRVQVPEGELTAGRIGLFQVDDPSALEPARASRFRPPAGTTPHSDDGSSRLRQGYLEQSNVDSLSEMVRMITVQRSFQGQTRALSSLHRMRSEFATQFDR